MIARGESKADPRQADTKGSAPQAGRLRALLGSAWARTALALALAAALRAWLIAGSHGMLDGDEASLGILAENILRGQHPVYFPGQNYAGAVDAYLLAPLVALFDPSGWVTHVVTGVESLALVPVMGALAARLFGERARLPALLLTAIPPVYVGVTALRMLGGYIETLLIGSLLTLLALSIADRWRAGRHARWQWALAGLLTGLGFWISALVVAYVAALALWLAPLALTRMRQAWTRSRHETLANLARAAALTLIGLITGAAPALFSPQTYTGANPLIPSRLAGATSQGSPKNPTRIPDQLHFAYYFVTKGLPTAIGARLTYPPIAQNAVGLALGLAAGLIALGGVLALLRAVRWPRPLAALFADRARWNAALPVALGAIILGGYLARKLISPGLLYIDEARYLLPLTTPLTLALAYTYVAVTQRDSWGPGLSKRIRQIWPHTRPGTVVAAALLLVTLTTYGATWLLSDPVMALSSPFNESALRPGGAFPAEGSGLLSYLEKRQIHYAWANHWVGDVVMYLSDQRTLTSDYVDTTVYSGIDRFPQATSAVASADRPSFIVAWSGPDQPPLAGALNRLGVRYTSAQFGRFWVFTPITRTVRPEEVATDLASLYW